MPLIKFEKLPRQYNWNINGYQFQFIVENWEDDNAAARDILIHDLEAVLAELRTMPVLTAKGPFKLPPLNPNSTADDRN